MMHYTLSRLLDDGDEHTSATFTERDPVNAAHLIAAYFNTVNRPMLDGFALGVVNTRAASVEYEGKTEQIKRDDPWSISQTFEFKADPDGENLVTLFGDGARTVFPAKLSFAKNEKAAETLAKSAAPHIARSVLEEAYAELQEVKAVLADAGVETIPADRGVNDLRHIIGARNAQIEELKAEVEELDKRDEPEPSAFAHVARDVLEDAYDEYLLVCEMLSEIGVETIPISAGVDELRERVAELTKRNSYEFHARSMYEQVEGQKREAARAELISHVKSERTKWYAAEERAPVNDAHMQAWFRGMIDVLAKFLVITGEAAPDEGHAVARRLVESEEV